MKVLTKIKSEPVICTPDDFVIASYGGGTNSTALLVECVKRGIRVDVITFADTGGEKPHTYAYVEYFSKWLVAQGYPEIITVKANTTLEADCLKRNALPSLAYGFKTCSQRFKIAPQEKFFNNLEAAKAFWRSGRKIVRLIGYDADEPYRVREYEDKKYSNAYPLVEWNMGRDECVQSIKDAGLEQPGKSACFFCPSSQVSEIKWLQVNHPELLDRALKIESQAELTQVTGLGRNFAWQSVADQGDMFADNLIAPELACGCYDGGAA